MQDGNAQPIIIINFLFITLACNVKPACRMETYNRDGTGPTEMTPFIYLFPSLNRGEIIYDDTYSRPPCTLHPTPYILHPTPCILHPAPYTLHPTPYTLHPTRQTPSIIMSTIHPEGHAMVKS